MPPKKKKLTQFLENAPAKVVTVLVLITTVLGAWWQFENKMEEIVNEAAIVLSKDFKQRTDTIMEFLRDDIKFQIRKTQREIDTYKLNGREVPESLQLTLESLQDQLEEVERKWHTE